MDATRSLRAFGWLAHVAAFVSAVVALAATVALVVAEGQWAGQNAPQPDPAAAFVHGSIGTELAPLVAFEVLPDLFPDEFRPAEAYLAAAGKAPGAAGDWVEQYGFVPRALAPDPRGDGDLPVGFVLSYHRPGSGAPSPVPFVGLSCAACHSGEVRTAADRPGVVVYGVGNPSLNLLAFSEAVRGALVKRTDPVDPKSPHVLTVAAVREAHARRGRELTPAETALVWAWLRAARAETEEYQRVVDEPYGPAQLFDPDRMLAGPGRTQPFRSLVRVHLDRPGWAAGGHQMDQGFSKIPAVFHQHRDFHGDWAQFDGSVRHYVARSTLAASTAGANVHNLAEPDIAANIERAADYTLALAPPAWESVFPAEGAFRLDRTGAAVRRGAAVYRDECLWCHGGPDGKGGWAASAALRRDVRLPSGAVAQVGFGEVVPLDLIGTDPERVRFRHKEAVARVVVEKFRSGFKKNHPLGTFTEDDLRAPDGYYAGPIGGTFLRAPYLHNASVLTLAELVGLEARRDIFYRGRSVFDPARVGYTSPPVPRDPDGRPRPSPHDRHSYFLFDTRVRGNSNKGHEYPPWAFDPARRPTADQLDDLRALLEYLKTL